MKVAVAGIGQVATGNYLPYLAERSDVELAVWNRSEPAAQAAAAQFGARAFAGLDGVMGWSPDVVFVLTSERVRLDVARPFVEAGVPRMFMEKPLVARGGQASVTIADFEEARAFVSLARQAGTQLAINFNYRSFQTVRWVLERLASGELGDVLEVSVRTHYACWSHVLDLARVIAGDVTRVAALEGTQTRSGMGIAAPDVSVAFESASGATGTVTGTSGGVWDPSLFEVTVNCSGGRLRFWDLDAGAECHRDGLPFIESLQLSPQVSRWDRYGASFTAALDAYFASLEADQPPPVSGRDGLLELQFEAAIRAAREERVEINVHERFSL